MLERFFYSICNKHFCDLLFYGIGIHLVWVCFKFKVFETTARLALWLASLNKPTNQSAERARKANPY